MKVNVINEYRIEMELAEDELSFFDITYDSMDYGDINTRRFLTELAQNAKRFGIEADMSGKVLIEAFRIRGGCRLCFTFLPPNGKDAPSVKQLIKKDIAGAYFSTADLWQLCRFCAAAGAPPESSLYFFEDKYRLFISDTPSALEKYKDTAAEFSLEYSSDASVPYSRSREHGKCVFAGEAVRQLTAL